MEVEVSLQQDPMGIMAEEVEAVEVVEEEEQVVVEAEEDEKLVKKVMIEQDWTNTDQIE